jgi:hypothetical protein
MGFVVNEVALEQVFSPAKYHSTDYSTFNIIIYHPGLVE